jgi:flagellar assembly factor FliW
MLNLAASEVQSATESLLASMTTPPEPSSSAEPETYLVESRYGELTFGPDQMVQMSKPVLGFPHLTKFGLAKLPSQMGNNLVLLQSLEDANISFPCFALDMVNPLIEENDLKAAISGLGVKAEDCAILCILTVRQDETGKNAVTLNLRAPVIVDSARKTAWQTVLNNARYPIRHPL